MSSVSGEEWDEESQITLTSKSSSSSLGKPSRRAGGLRSFPVRMNFTQPIVEQFRKEYGIDPILRTSEEFHAHPHLAFQRNCLEALAIKDFNQKCPKGLLADVGSAARRYEKTRVHCVCPHLQPGDDTRWELAMKNRTRGNSVCRHVMQECTCGPFDSMLFTHSAYYFTTKEIIKFVKATKLGCVYVVGHLFPEALGSFAYDEGTYHFDLECKNDVIVTKVRGNEHHYRHAPLPWDSLNLGSEGLYLHAELMAVKGDTRLWLVRVSDIEPNIAPSRSWLNVIVDEKHVGPVRIPGFDTTTKQALSSNGVVDVEVDHLHGWYGWLWSETRNGRCYIPRSAIHETAMKIMGKKRDPALMQDCIYIMRSAIGSSRLPPAQRLQATTIGAALAFNINVRNEVDVVHTLTSRYTKLWKLHESLYALTPQRACNISVVLLILGISLTILFVVEPTLFLTDNDELEYTLPPLILSLGALFVSTCCVCMFCVARYQSRRTSDNWSTTLYVESRASNMTGDVMEPLIKRFPAHPFVRQPLIPNSGTLEIGADQHPPRHPGLVSTPLGLDGVGVANAVPTAPRTDQESEVTAITHRVLTQPTIVAPDALSRFYQMNGVAARQLKSIRVAGSPTMHEDWMAQAKWTIAQRNKFQIAWKKSLQGQKISKGQFHCFVKFEKMKVVNADGVEALKTRLINGPPDQVKVAVGPWTSLYQKELCKTWDGRRSPICYTSGMTPDEIGRVMDEFAASVGGWSEVVGVWDDCALYDSTLENELLLVRKELYPKAGFPPYVMNWMESTQSRGVSQHGVTFELAQKLVTKVREDGSTTQDKEVIRRLFSGELDTNLIGSIINGLAHESGLPEGLKWAMFVCGDDNLTLTTRNGFSIGIAENLKSHLEDLGLKPTQGISDRRCDWEFCSKLLWFGRDPQNGHVQTVLGPKPARWLSRIGWTLKHPTEPNFPEVMLSARDDTHHIPLLNEYVAKGLLLCKGKRRRGRVWSEMKHVSKRYDCVPENFNLLQERYHISAEVITSAERIILGMKEVGTVINLPWLATAAKRDEE